MATITLEGNPFHTNGDLPSTGTEAPDFILVDGDLNDKRLSDFADKKIILNIVPSLDTPVCALSTKEFNKHAARLKDVMVLVISADLPFAQARFCSSEDLVDVVALSMMRSRRFAKDYGVLIEDGPLAGITGRAVVVIDTNGQVIHSQLVKEIAHEPDYDAALAAL